MEQKKKLYNLIIEQQIKNILT